MKINSGYAFTICGLIIGFLLSLVGSTLEDYWHGVPVSTSISSFHHYIVPLFLAPLSGIFGFILWKQISNRTNAKNEITKNLQALLDVNANLISTLDLDSVLQIIITESTQLTSLDTGAIYLHENETLYLGATTPPLPSEFPEALRHDLLINHPNIRKSLDLRQPVILQDTNNAILSEAEIAVIKFRGLRSVIYIPLIMENRPIGTLILGTINRLRSFSKHEIDLYQTFSGPASLVIENARLYKTSFKISEELRLQNEEILQLNSELTKSYERAQKINDDLNVAKDKAEESDRLKSAFLANMSHEIRTPMNGILGFTELLKEPNLTGEEQQEYINIIQKSGARMLNIINDIVDISKIESGLMQVDLKESNINVQFEDIYSFFKADVERKGITFKYNNLLPLEDAIITTDPEKLFAILTNLVKNAIKYSDNGSIEFGCDVVETHGRASLQFFVKDTGIGISKNRQEAIFERFIQADIADLNARQGAGLGLAITKSYVEMLGGKIWVESEEGKGSSFYFTIPYNLEQKKEIGLAKSNLTEAIEVDLVDLNILIVDDEDISRKYLATILKTLSKNLFFTQNGKEAVEFCKGNHGLDLILMDIKMPVMNGHEATVQIRQHDKEVVIIAQTAFGLEGDREKSINAGCNGYISKPVKKEKLLSLIREHFAKN